MSMTIIIRYMSKQFAIAIMMIAMLAVSALFSISYAFEIKEITSPKGIKAWLVSDSSVPIISMRFSFDGGTSQDPAGKEGITTLMSGLFDEGAGDLEADAFQERLDDLGGEMRFSANVDKLSGSVRMLAENHKDVLDLVALAVNKPRFDQVAVDRIRSQLVTSLEASQRNPQVVAKRKLDEALYGEHPYARPDEGTISTLNTIEVEDLAALHRKTFARDNLLVGVVGAISEEELGPILDEVFGDLPANAELLPVSDAVPSLGATTSVSYDLPQTSITLVYPAVPVDDPDFFPSYVMNYILGDGFSSRLYNEVREKRGLAYSASSYLSLPDHASSLIISTGTRSDKAAETLQIIREVVADLAKNGVTEAELAEAKSYLIGSYAVNNLSSSGSIAATLVGLQDQGRALDYINERPDLINAVTLDEVKNIAEKLLTVDPAILIVGPAQN